MEENEYSFKAVIKFEKYYNPDNFYGCYNAACKEKLPSSAVYNDLETEDDDEKELYYITIAGKMQRLYIGCEYKIEASLKYEEKYKAWQYIPKNILEIKPKNIKETRRFLQDIIPKKKADELLKYYPNIVENIIEDKKIDLSKIKGIKEKSFQKIKEKVINTYPMSGLSNLLYPLGVTLKTVQKIYNFNSEQNIEIFKEQIKRNPYMLINVKGLGFKKVDNIAMKINSDIRISKERVVAFLEIYFEELGNNKGHTYCKLKDLNSEVLFELNECYKVYLNFIEEETKNPKYLYIKDDIVGLMKYYKVEKSIYDTLCTIDEFSINYNNHNEIDFNKSIYDTEQNLGFSLTDEQKDSIISTLDNGITIITAKSGSGKTTCLKGIVELYKDILKIALCSLSAKAARRMEEATGFKANTIHRLLGYEPKNDEIYKYNSEKKLPYDLIIIDEATMISADLFLALIKAFNPLGKLVIVFDNGQLPPIGYGNVATDLLNSNFNVRYLTKVHRQAEESGILVDGNKIRDQINPIDKLSIKEVHGKLQDMCYMFRENRNQMRNILINNYLKYIDNLGIQNIVIIIPRKSNCINSCSEINKIIQDKLIDDNKPFLNRGDMKFKIGSRIIQKVNDPEKNVFNGELGFICNIGIDENNESYFEVKFDDGNKIVRYLKQELSNIQLSYAVTCHSFQGSEIHTALVCIDNTHYNLLSCNWLYTAVTRAKKRCLLVAEADAFYKCLHTKADMNRKTFLSLILNNRKYVK